MRALCGAAIALAVIPALASASGRVILDPGHGGADSGAIGRLGAIIPEALPVHATRTGAPVLHEKDVTLDVALRAADILRSRGWTVTLTRTAPDRAGGDLPYTTTGADLAARVDVARRIGGDAFVSIHANAATSPTATGSETYHFRNADATAPAEGLATALQTAMVPTLGLVDRGVRTAGFYVLRHAVMPAALVEGGFMTNPTDLAVMASVAGRQRWAESIAAGVQAWRSGNPPTSPIAATSVTWTVRATLVRTRPEARRIAGQLRRAGARVTRIRPATLRQRRVWSVSLGTFATRAEAQAAAALARGIGLRPRMSTAVAPTTPLPVTGGSQRPQPQLAR